MRISGRGWRPACGRRWTYWRRWRSRTGDTLDYTYELKGDTLTIWFGDRGSPAYYRGELSDDGNTLAGAWHYPGGGGYEAISRRIG